MYRKLLLCLCLLPALLGTARAEDSQSSPAGPEVKEISGMSVVGNDEAPKSLSIVPWKKSELALERRMNKMLTETPEPVDREEFQRQLNFYELSTKK